MEVYRICLAKYASELVASGNPGRWNLRGQMVYEVADLLDSHGIPFLFATGYDPELVPASHRARP